MEMKAIALLAIHCLALFYPGHGLSAHGPLTKEEDSELEARLKTLNKPPVRTLKAFNGDIIDCIDMYKQPAFDHPLLKNHKIEIKPSFLPLGVKKKRTAQATPVEQPYLLGECPNGTVPIRRTTKEDLIRHHFYGKTYVPKYNSSLVAPPLTHFAYLSLEAYKRGPLFTAEGYIDVYNPNVEAGQFSTGQILITDGPEELSASKIEAGWMVNPNLYGDHLTHFFTRWTGGGGVGTGCYDMACPGFVQTNPRIPVGFVLRNFSVYGHVPYDIVVQVGQRRRGSWWLFYGDKRDEIGYWPRNLFQYFSSGASRISFGGQVGRAPNRPSPPMGSGHFPDHDFTHSSYIRLIRYRSSQKRLETPSRDGTATHVDVPLCYNVTDEGDLGGVTGYATTFGGPGGNCD
ncbi:uncharacterized protein LOC115727112 [Rhodamnia argentea]|uniref:Uncharacterized protein LOC115727112 n=1 Tax=Rhodamnia argentea TaxID=178133 RepID=A0A8B8MST1_9MYRT|nr:uncharacterized protein LOC115727112 [Rhodamnia argentea]